MPFSILLASVYMPADDASLNSETEFEVCGSLNALITDCSVSSFIICGVATLIVNLTLQGREQ